MRSESCEFVSKGIHAISGEEVISRSNKESRFEMRVSSSL